MDSSDPNAGALHELPRWMNKAKGEGKVARQGPEERRSAYVYKIGRISGFLVARSVSVGIRNHTCLQNPALFTAAR